MTSTLLSNTYWRQTKSPDQIQTSLVQRLAAWGRQVFTNESSSDRKLDDMELDEIIRMTGEW
jgi:hypothetical protein